MRAFEVTGSHFTVPVEPDVSKFLRVAPGFTARGHSGVSVHPDLRHIEVNLSLIKAWNRLDGFLVGGKRACAIVCEDHLHRRLGWRHRDVNEFALSWQPLGSRLCIG